MNAKLIILVLLFVSKHFLMLRLHDLYWGGYKGERKVSCLQSLVPKNSHVKKESDEFNKLYLGKKNSECRMAELIRGPWSVSYLRQSNNMAQR